MIAFGPIPSRRLGLSLGINNITTGKVCSYGCVYCQIGKTPRKVTERQVFYEPENLVKNVEAHLKKLDSEHSPDYLTFVANGEPTLDINLGTEIRLLKKTGIPVAVISNASLMHIENVWKDLMQADWVSLKIDSVNEQTWRKINSPSEWLSLNEIIEGIKSFSADYKGKLHTETMLVEGYNDSVVDLEQTAIFNSQIKPSIAYISIPTRPPALKEINAVSETKITEAWNIFSEKGIKTELITGFEGSNAGFTGNAIEDILNITAVHPLREDSMAELIRKENTDTSALNYLLNMGLIKKINYKGMDYYSRCYKNT